MIIPQQKRVEEYSRLLEKISDEIDISISLYQQAEKRYKSVAEWLGRDESLLAQYSPHIYPQGSFLIGTVTKPIVEEDGCDIDLVCCLGISTGGISWDELKKIIGDEIKKNGKYKKMLKEEGRRCWTIVYSEKEPIQFHLDILPAIPNETLVQADNPFRKDALLITDNVLKRFMGSNPKGYAEWFKQQMIVQKSFDYQQRVKLMAEHLNCEIEAVPTYALKTPLQRSVQIFKRHRDIEYQDKTEEEQEDKPISIIITTLAARAYGDIQRFPSNDLYTVAKTILTEMPKYIIRKRNDEGKEISWVGNPTDKTENFADKWEQYPEREFAFRQWLNTAKKSLDKAFKEKSIHSIAESLKMSFGDRAVNKALAEFYDKGVGSHRKDGLLGVMGKNAMLQSINEEEKSVKVPKNTFHGENEDS